MKLIFLSLSCNYSTHFVFDCAVNRTMRSRMDIIALARGRIGVLSLCVNLEVVLLSVWIVECFKSVLCTGWTISDVWKCGYAETLCIQENRKSEGEKMKRWAEAAWRNRSLSLSEALKISDSSNRMPVVDARICRAL
ncbi:hypothetical protein NC652_006034 [Populus alba x Populus x berolinensis]|nr:hypothetical protein NC652_006034 [Populus alba x Populus x berolinensis]